MPQGDPLALVSGKNKAIRITSEEMGETVSIGSGPEPLATAAAALKDLEHVLIARLADRSRHVESSDREGAAVPESWIR